MFEENKKNIETPYKINETLYKSIFSRCNFLNDASLYAKFSKNSSLIFFLNSLSVNLLPFDIDF